MVLVLLSASAERCFVSRMQDFSIPSSRPKYQIYRTSYSSTVKKQKNDFQEKMASEAKSKIFAFVHFHLICVTQD